MRILLVNATAYPQIGGVENSLHYIAQALLSEGHEVKIFCFQFTPGEPLSMNHAGVEIIRYFPKAFEFLLQQKFDMNYYGWFILLAIVVVLSETLINTANGLLLIKTSAIARQMIRFVLLPLVAILFFFDRNILADYGIVLILGSFIVGYIIAAVVSIISIYQDQRLKIQIGWLLPKGFWNLSLKV